MLGDSISDPEGVEEGGMLRGMGLLPMETVFAGEKTRTRVEGTIGSLPGVFSGLEGLKVEGYEIHMGVTTWKETGHALTRLTDAVSGQSKEDGGWYGNTGGSYVHGFFDCQEIANAMVSGLAQKKGIVWEELGQTDYETYKQKQYDILADTLRCHLDMKKIYQILEEGLS